MSGLTVDRAIEIQNHLVRAMLGKHNVGSNEAEIYVYLALCQSPAIDAYVQSGGAEQGRPSIFKDDFVETYTEAFQDFRRLFLRFEKAWQCRVHFRGDSSQPWRPARELEGVLTTHRFYVKVESTRET